MRGGFRSVVLALLFAALLLVPAPGQALETQRWLLEDQAGRPWSLTLLEQVDPSDRPGPRLRLTDRSGSHQLDHTLPLRLRDGLGGTWQLENRSAELVAAGETALPEGSAQFALPPLQPRLRSELPLLLVVPLASGASSELMTSPAAVAALHDASAA